MINNNRLNTDIHKYLRIKNHHLYRVAKYKIKTHSIFLKKVYKLTDKNSFMPKLSEDYF